MKQNIQIIDALAGSGKTYTALQHAVKQVQQGRKVIFCQPTINLIRHSIADVKAFNINIQIHEIHSGVSEFTVQQELAEFLDNNDQPCILFVTHSTLSQNKFWKEACTWDLYIDELPQIIQEFKPNLPWTHSLLTDCLSFNRNGTDFIDVSGTGNINHIADNRQRDDIYKVITPVLEKVRNPNYEVSVSKETLTKLNSQNGGQFNFYATLQPSVFEKFRSVTLMSANLRDSFLYSIWRNKVEFIDHDIQDEIKARLSRHLQQNIEIKYMFENSWSKSKRKITVEVNGKKQNAMALFVEQTTELMGSQDFLWVANNDQPDELFWQENAQRISNVSHGLNCYKTKNNIAFMSALNPSPGHIKYLKHLGLTDNEIRTAGSNQTMYQCVLRTSIRDLSSTAKKIVVVPDFQAALYLQKMFPNATVSQCIACTETVKKVGRRKKKTALTSAERVRKHRAKKKSEQDMLKTNYANAR